MRTRLIPVAVALLAIAVVALLPEAPAAAQSPSAPCVGCHNNGQPQATPDGYYAGIGDSINRLNSGGSSSGEPVPCGEDDLFAYADPDPDVDHSGHFAYVTPLNEQAVFDTITGNTEAGTWWRLICVFDDGFTPFDDLVDVEFFPEVTAQNLVGYAVDTALTLVPAPQVRINPTGDQLVNFRSWLWVDGIATTTFPGPSVSIPGIVIDVEISTGGVWWNMGDGTSFGCAGTGTPYGEAAEPTCSHTYTRSSAGQPSQTFSGSASIRWTARYWVNGAGPFAVDDVVVRTTPFTVRVGEGQAIVTG